MSLSHRSLGWCQLFFLSFTKTPYKPAAIFLESLSQALAAASTRRGRGKKKEEGRPFNHLSLLGTNQDEMHRRRKEAISGHPLLSCLGRNEEKNVRWQLLELRLPLKLFSSSKYPPFNSKNSTQTPFGQPPKAPCAPPVNLLISKSGSPLK